MINLHADQVVILQEIRHYASIGEHSTAISKVNTYCSSITNQLGIGLEEKIAYSDLAFRELSLGCVDNGDNIAALRAARSILNLNLKNRTIDEISSSESCSPLTSF